MKWAAVGAVLLVAAAAAAWPTIVTPATPSTPPTYIIILDGGVSGGGGSGGPVTVYVDAGVTVNLTSTTTVYVDAGPTINNWVCLNDAACLISPNFVTTYAYASDGGWGLATNLVTANLYLTDTGLFSVTVTGQAWVTQASRIVCAPYAGADGGMTPELVAVGGVEAYAGNLANGVGFDVFVLNPNGLVGPITVHCHGA